MSRAMYRILVDENTSPRVARLLRGSGHDAVHVTVALAVGATDSEIAAHASETSRVVLTHDDDFLRPEYTREISVLYRREQAECLGVVRKSKISVMTRRGASRTT